MTKLLTNKSEIDLAELPLNSGKRERRGICHFLQFLVFAVTIYYFGSDDPCADSNGALCQWLHRPRLQRRQRRMRGRMQ